LDILALLPWWVSVLLSGTAFVTLKYIVTEFDASPSNFVWTGLAGAASRAAPFVALVLLIPAPVSAINSWRKRKLLDKQESIDSIRNLGWRAFEELVGEAYRRQGYSVSENPGTGPDGGIDLFLRKDGELTIVQCKQWRANKVGVEKVRELYGVHVSENAGTSILITSGFLTQEAKNFAADKPIDLVEGPQLLDLIKNVQPTNTKTTSKPNSSVVCPECGSEMLVRTAQRGANLGQKFWGCSTFPNCRATKPYQG
jgi:restriction system protein